MVYDGASVNHTSVHLASDGRRQLTRRQQWVALAAIVLIALALRAYRIDWQSAWHDENYTIYTSGLELGPMHDRIVDDFVHPPLHYYLLHYWMKLFGYGQLSSRALSLVFGLLSVPLIFLLGRRLLSSGAGLMAALLLAISQLGVNHSQEGRPYALALFLVLGSIYTFARAVRERRAVFWWAYVAISILMVYSHYYTAFIVVAQVVFLLLYRRSYPIPRHWWVIGALLAAAAYLPWLSGGILERMAESTKVGSRDLDVMGVRWYTPISSLNWFHNGKWNGLYAQSPLWAYPAGCLLFGIPVLLALAPHAHRHKPSGNQKAERDIVVLLLLLLFLPVILTIAISSLVGLQFDVRYIVFAIAPYYLLAGWGITRIRPFAARAVVLLVLCSYSLGALRANYFISYKPDYRSTVAYVSGEYRDGDCCAFSMRLIDGLPLFWRVQQPDHPGLTTRSPEELLSGNTDCRRIWLIWDHTWWRNRGKRYESIRDGLASVYSLTGSQWFSGISIYRYEPK